jgi:hypothetical protein
MEIRRFWREIICTLEGRLEQQCPDWVIALRMPPRVPCHNHQAAINLFHDEFDTYRRGIS